MELLSTAEWRTKRSTILERDHYECSHCHGTETLLWPAADTGIMMPHEVRFRQPMRQRQQAYMANGELDYFPIFHPADICYTPTATHRRMHVHHSLYIYGYLPWQYNDEQLQTLCERCHYQWHQQHQVKVYEQTAHGLVAQQALTPCQRCGGAGRLPQYDYVEAGICFRCWGACFEEWITPALKKRSQQLYAASQQQ